MKTRFILLVSAVIAAAWGLRIERQLPEIGEESGGIDIYNLFVTSEIRHRFATTLVTSRVANKEAEDREVTFYMQLPNEAFISNFTMEIDGEVRVGEVQEKEAAEKRYQAARARGDTAGQVKARARESNSFRVSVNVAAESSVTFNLTYQELLTRRLGMYEHVININPGQIVHDMRIVVNINESRELTSLKVPKLRENFEGSFFNIEEENDQVTVYRGDSYDAEIVFAPTVEEQQEMSDNGIVGQFAVQYDVKRGYDGGEVEISNGYFTHYFAPDGLEPISKDVVFVLDISGSMYGRKIQQVRDSMNIILGELREGDRFNILLFDDRVVAWKGELQRANQDSIAMARKFVTNIEDRGGTNINLALLNSVELLQNQNDKDKVPIIIFLTDGQPTSGVTSTTQILANVRAANEGQFSIYSLGYGSGVDFGFLKQLSLQNGGLARKIYEDSDATLQLRGFYKEVATPLLRNVKFNYIGEGVDSESLTKSDFNTFYSGGEFVIAGKFNRDKLAGKVAGIQIVGESKHGKIEFGFPLIQCNPAFHFTSPLCPPIDPVGPTTEVDTGSTDAAALFQEHLWAYLTVKEILTKRTAASSSEMKEIYTQRALDMSIKYNFVTKVTSMIVVQDGNERLMSDDGTNRNAQRDNYPSGPSYHRSPTGAGLPMHHGFADSDPHILTNVGGIPVCFNLDGEEGEEYVLFEDHDINVKMYGTLKSRHHAVNKSFFEAIRITVKKIQLNFISSHKKPLVPQIKGGSKAAAHKLFTIDKQRHLVNFTFEQGLKLSVHLGKHKFGGHVVKFLGLYIDTEPIYTERCPEDRFTGVIGQFMCDSAKVLPVIAPPVELAKNFTSGLADIARLRVWDEFGFEKEVFSAAGSRRNLEESLVEPCWFVHDQGQGIMKKDILHFRLHGATKN